MNDMNETLAEIHRRADTRIRARKQFRNRITALCVPLLLCAAAMFAMPDGNQTRYVNRPLEIVIPQNTQTYTQPTVENQAPVVLTVKGEDFERSYTDPQTAEKLRDMLLSWTVSGQSTVHASEKFGVGSQYSMTDDPDGGLRLILLDGETPKEYILYTNYLFDVEENKGISISTGQYNALRNFLELS